VKLEAREVEVVRMAWAASTESPEATAVAMEAWDLTVSWL
jgi:hypothetical protein